MARSIPEKVIRSSGNVFADMGLPDGAGLDINARLGATLNLIVERQRLTQVEVATALGINQPVQCFIGHAFAIKHLGHVGVLIFGGAFIVRNRE